MICISLSKQTMLDDPCGRILVFTASLDLVLFYFIEEREILIERPVECYL